MHYERSSCNLTLSNRSQAVYKQSPDLTREGGSIPVTLTFAESLNKNVLLLPMGRGDDGAQYVIRVQNYRLVLIVSQLHQREVGSLKLY